MVLPSPLSMLYPVASLSAKHPRAAGYRAAISSSASEADKSGDAVQRKPERKAARISSKVAKMALAALRKAIDESGEIPPACNHIPAKKNTVSIKCWRRWFCHADGADTVEAKRKNFHRGREALQAEGCVGWAPEKGGEEDIQCRIIS